MEEKEGTVTVPEEKAAKSSPARGRSRAKAPKEEKAPKEPAPKKAAPKKAAPKKAAPKKAAPAEQAFAEQEAPGPEKKAGKSFYAIGEELPFYLL